MSVRRPVTIGLGMRSGGRLLDAARERWGRFVVARSGAFWRMQRTVAPWYEDTFSARAYPRVRTPAALIPAIWGAAAVALGELARSQQAIRDQLSITRATWGLAEWEWTAGVPVRPALSVAQRRARVVGYLRARLGTITELDYQALVALFLTGASGLPIVRQELGKWLVLLPADRGWVEEYEFISGLLGRAGRAARFFGFAPWDDVNGLSDTLLDRVQALELDALHDDEMDGPVLAGWLANLDALTDWQLDALIDAELNGGHA